MTVRMWPSGVIGLYGPCRPGRRYDNPPPQPKPAVYDWCDELDVCEPHGIPRPQLERELS